MAIDCKVLSPNAQEIFERLKSHFPPDPFKNAQWFPEGIVVSNGQYDLRRSIDRERLIENTTNMLGYLVGVKASGYRADHGGSLEGFTHEPFSDLIQPHAELLLLLEDLHFQIETMDPTEV